MREKSLTERVTLMMEPADLRAVDEWRRSAAAIPSRGEAIRQLVRLGLEAMQAERKPQPAEERR